MKRRRTALCLAMIMLFSAAMALPQLIARIGAERKNDSVVFSLLYTDLEARVSGSELDRELDKFADAGVTSVTVPETTADALIARGEVTGLRWHDIRHRFDAEGREIEALIDGSGAVADMTYDSHVFIVRREAAEAALDFWLPLYYAADEWEKVGHAAGCAVYIFFDGNTETYNIRAGFDTAAIERAAAHGFDIALSMRAFPFRETGYIGAIAGIAEKYGVRFINIKADAVADKIDEDERGDENADMLAGLLSGGATLVLTENADQLSNSRPFGFEKIFDAARGRVMRSFETYSDDGDDLAREYKNSVTDRNIRFITVTVLRGAGKTAAELSSLTADAVEKTAGRLAALGYDVGGETASLEGYGRPVYVAALAAVFTLAALGLTVELLRPCGARLLVATACVAAAAFVATFFMPRALLALYPTALAVAVPSLAAAVSLTAARRLTGKGWGAALAATVGGGLAVSLLGGAVMAALTSGLSYYINNDIFRGIKLSLTLPILFSAVVYYIVFERDKRDESTRELAYSALTANVRVWWCVAALAAAGVLLYYLRRSGNVTSIPAAEAALRGFLSDALPARPRTKEYLFAYPCAVLFARHAGRGRALPFAAAVGAALLPVSVMNTFCHVFTDVTVMLMRTATGLVFGLVTGAVVLALDEVAVRLWKS